LNIAVLHIVDGKVAELTGFDATDTPWLGLPPTLSSDKVPIVDESSARAAVTEVTCRMSTRPAEHQRGNANTTVPPATPARHLHARGSSSRSTTPSPSSPLSRQQVT